MAVSRKYREYDKVDPQTGVWPVVVTKAATIDDLIASLSRIREEHGNLELLSRTPTSEYADVRIVWTDDIDELVAVVDEPFQHDLSSGVMQDGQPVQYGTQLDGTFLMF